MIFPIIGRQINATSYKITLLIPGCDYIIPLNNIKKLLRICITFIMCAQSRKVGKPNKTSDKKLQ